MKGSQVRMIYLTSGESHGPQLTVIVEDIRANLIKVDKSQEMFKRQGGYGRGDKWHN